MSASHIGAHSGANEFLADWPMAKHAEQLTTMAPAILKEAKKAAQELSALIVASSGDQGGTLSQHTPLLASRPRLTPPNELFAPAPAIAKDDEAQAQARHHSVLLAELVAVLEQGSLNKQVLNAKLAVLRDGLRESGSIRLVEEYQAKVGAVADMLDQLQVLTSKLQNLSTLVSSLQQQLAEAEASLATLLEGTPEFDAALLVRDSLRQQLAQANVDRTTSETQVQQLRGAVDALQDEVHGLLAEADDLKIDLPRPVITQDQTNIARLLLLMTTLGQLMLNTGAARADSQRSILKLQEDMRLKKLIKDAEKAEREIEKAEALNKAMGCVGKILGAVVTTIAIVGAVFTGGASLALAGIGLALMLADQIYSGVTGHSFINEAMKPIMKLLQPILQFLIEKMAVVLESCGVDAQVAKTAAMILVSVAIAVAVAVLAITGVGGAVASAVSNVIGRLSSTLTKVLEKTMEKLLPEILKAAMKGAAKSASNAAASASKFFSEASTKMVDAVLKRFGLSNDLVAKQVYSQHMYRAAAGVNLASTVATGSLNVVAQHANVEAAKAIASMRFTMSELDLLNDMFANILEQFKTAFSASQGMFSRASDAINQHTSTGSAVARSIMSSRSA